MKTLIKTLRSTRVAEETEREQGKRMGGSHGAQARRLSPRSTRVGSEDAASLCRGIASGGRRSSSRGEAVDSDGERRSAGPRQRDCCPLGVHQSTAWIVH